MTDWLPWGGAFMAGVLTTVALALRAVSRTPVGERPGLGPAWRAWWATVAASTVLYLLYLVAGEGWLWY